MQKDVHRVALRVFWKPGEDISSSYQKIMPFSSKELEQVILTEEESEDLYQRSVIIERKRLIASFMTNLFNVLDEEDKHTIVTEIDERIDNAHFELFLRLDKKTLRLISGGNCFHIKLTVAAYPKTKE